MRIFSLSFLLEQNNSTIWLSIWGYLLYVLIIIVIVWSVRYVTAKVTQKKRLLDEINKERDKAKKLIEEKDKLFSNLNNELINPLTMIISSLDTVIKENIDNKELCEKLNLVNNNAIKLLERVNPIHDIKQSGIKTNQIALKEEKEILNNVNSVENQEKLDVDDDIQMVDTTEDFPYIRTIQEIQASILAEKLSTEVNLEEKDQQISLNELGIETVSTIKLQRATVIQLTEEQENCYSKKVMSPDDFTNYESQLSKSLGLDDEVSQLTKDLLLDKDGNPKKKIDFKPTAVIIDDDLDFLEYMQEILSFDYNVILVKSGTNPWEIIKDIKPNIIICDHKRNLVDGKELCHIVKNNIVTAQIPFLLLTVDNQDNSEEESFVEGPDDYISKPFNVEILMLRMKKLIDDRNNKFNSYIDPLPSEIAFTSIDEKLVENAIKYIEENMSKNDFSVEELSKSLGINRVNLYKKILAITGKTPIELIRIIRLKRAEQLLKENQLTVSEIAYKVGFNNQNYFIKYFKQEYGVLPYEVQDNNN